MLQNYILPKLVKHTIILFFPPFQGTSFVKIVFWKERSELDENANIGISCIDFEQIAWVCGHFTLTSLL
jgi:hypothetical protein